MFESILAPILIGGISVFSSIIASYAVVKNATKTEKIMGVLDEILQETSENEVIQKKIYLIGAILGQGIIAGTGLKKGTGKFKWQDIAGQVLGQFLSSGKLGNLLGGTAQQGQPQGEGQLQGLFEQ